MREKVAGQQQKISYAIPQHLLLWLEPHSHAPVFIGQLSVGLPPADSLPCFPLLKHGTFHSGRGREQLMVQWSHFHLLCVPQGCFHRQLWYPPLLTTMVGAHPSLFCDIWRQKGCSNWECKVLDVGFRLCFREWPTITSALSNSLQFLLFSSNSTSVSFK